MKYLYYHYKKSFSFLYLFKIWDHFYKTYSDVKKNLLTHDQTAEKTFRWAKMFFSIYHLSDFTPYMHIFSSHLHQFVKIHSGVNDFNTQGLEKLNDFTTVHYFRSTSKHPKTYLHQLLNKRNRLEYLSRKLKIDLDQNEIDQSHIQEENLNITN